VKLQVNLLKYKSARILNENNWRATHHLAGKLWFAVGILITLCSLFLEAKTGEILFIAGIGIMVIVPVIYSFLYFKNHKTS
jgi:uncharacterized membrane protein